MPLDAPVTIATLDLKEVASCRGLEEKYVGNAMVVYSFRCEIGLMNSASNHWPFALALPSTNGITATPIAKEKRCSMERGLTSSIDIEPAAMSFQ
jgi:hypothetical protein